jgi:uncharacterized protein YqeY
MSLKEKLGDDLKKALRERDERRKLTVRLVLAAINNAEIDKGHLLSDEEILDVIAKQAKQRRESLAEFAKGGRQDLVAQEQAELDILLEYLPKQMTTEEVEALARQVIAEVGASGPGQMGLVMKPLLARVAGRADGKLVNEVVRGLLAESKA